MAGRAVKWFTTLLDEQALVSAGQITFDLLSGLAVANRKGSTVTRLLIDLMINPDTDGSRKLMSFGIVYVDTDAVAAGAFPDSDVADERVDWLMRGRMKVHANAAGETVAVPMATKSYDLRAQRICRAENDQLRMIFDLNSITVGGVFVNGIIRTLVRLP